MSDTLRSHLEAIRDELRTAYADIPGGAGKEPLKRAYGHYEAMVAILDAAAFGFDIDHGWREDRLIPDPGMNPELADPDPVPVVSPRPNQQETSDA